MKRLNASNLNLKPNFEIISYLIANDVGSTCQIRTQVSHATASTEPDKGLKISFLINNKIESLFAHYKKTKTARLQNKISDFLPSVQDHKLTLWKIAI